MEYKEPVFAMALEEAVLGALMLEKDAIITVIEDLDPDSFFVEAHQLIYLSRHSFAFPNVRTHRYFDRNQSVAFRRRT
jgi:hypothetical protein